MKSHKYMILCVLFVLSVQFDNDPNRIAHNNFFKACGW